MTARLRILVDVNVVLDVLTKRDPHYEPSAAVWALVEREVVEGMIAAHTVTTVHYLVAKHLGCGQANVVISKLLRVFSVASIDQDVLLTALGLGWRDFEDAVQMAAALDMRADYLVTRNPQDFKDELVRVILPGDLVALFPVP